MFASEGERIELIHRASSRDTFARGALRAARFIADVQEGGRIFSMQDVLAEMLAAATEEA
jgi:4-hydroxy-tetrahydrodipicolinate reductase